MDPRQKNHIIQHMYQLIENTSVNSGLFAKLIQHRIISDEEKDEMDSLKTPFDKSFKLYWIVKTRNCYKKLMESLHEVNQTGAYDILNSIEDSPEPSSPRPPVNPEEETLKVFLNLYEKKMENDIKHQMYITKTTVQKIHETACIETENLCLDTKVVEEKEWVQIKDKLNNMFENSSWLKLTDSVTVLSSDLYPVIGIDLGTTNCVVAVFLNDKVKVIEILSANSIPSYIYFEKGGTKKVGPQAKRYAYKNPVNTIYDAKRFIGRTVSEIEALKPLSSWTFKILSENNQPLIYAEGKKYKPQEISGMLLHLCREEAEKTLGRTITKAVVTVPAYFNEHQHKATLEACEIAGIEVLGLLNEPLAAAIAYKLERLSSDPQMVLIFDIGGGTFDIAIVKIDNKNIDTIAKNGDTYLGGEDLDELLVQYCVKEFKHTTNIDLLDKRNNADTAKSLWKLREKCEEIKKELSAMDYNEENDIIVENIINGEDLVVKMTRRIFEEMITPLTDRMLQIIDDTLQSTTPRVEIGDIEDILLVGGTTRIPLIRKKLSQYFNGKDLNLSVNPDLAVAYGAAVNAAILNCESNKRKFSIEVIHDVIPMSIGISANINGKNDQFDRILQRNCRYPCEETFPYCTVFDDQEEVCIEIYQGECHIASKNTLLGQFTLRGIPPKRRGKEVIHVTMRINNLGILKVSASCTNGEKSLEVKQILTGRSSNK